MAIKSYCLGIASLLFLALPTGAQDTDAAAPDDTEIFHSNSGKSMEIDYYFPDDFDPAKPYPVMLSPGSFFLQDDPAAFGWVVIRAGIEERRFNDREAGEVLDHLMTRVTPRDGKFHMFGYSANSAGVFRVTAALNDRFAGVLAIPGHPRQPAEYEPLRHMKIRFIVGERDGFWLRESKAAHDRFEAMGTDTEIEIVPDGGHVLKHLAGRPLFERMDRWFR